MSLDGFNAAALLRELKALFERARLQKFSQITEYDFVAHFRAPGVTHKLLLSLHPERSRFHLLEAGHPAAIVPNSFVMLCRKHIGGTWLEEIRQDHLDRRIEFIFNSGFSLVFDWAGRPSALVLLQTEERKVVGLFPSRGRIERREPYRFPDPSPASPLTLNEAEVKKAFQSVPREQKLSQALDDISSYWSPLWKRRFTRAIESSTVGDTSAADFHRVWQRILGPLQDTDVPLKPGIDPDGELTYCAAEPAYPNMQAAANARWRDSSLAPGVSDDREELLRKLKKNREKAVRKLKKREQDRQGALTAPKDQLKGDLLLAYAHSLKRGSQEFVTHDWESNPITIALDPRMSVHENADRYYNKAKKKRRALEVLGTQLQLAQEEIEQWDDLIYAAQSSENRTDLEQVRRSMPSSVQKGKKKSVPQGPTSGPRRFVHDDFLILVGRNPAQNDKLSLKTAAKEDIWFHVRQGAGSHVLIKTSGRQVGEKTMEAAAWLAASFSQSSESSSVEVVTTRARFLKKPKGAPLGKVIYRQETELIIDPTQPQPEGLERQTKNGLAE